MDAPAGGGVLPNELQAQAAVGAGDEQCWHVRAPVLRRAKRLSIAAVGLLGPGKSRSLSTSTALRHPSSVERDVTILVE
jgi:hypothetical protein